MSESIFRGRRLILSLSGASHAPHLEFTLDGFPSGFRVDEAALAAFMERRAPGRDELSTARREADRIEFLQGIGGGVTEGNRIIGRIANTDQRPGDYGAERTVPRPGHADFGQWIRTGRIPTGGGMNSGRLTALLVAAGGLCRQFLERRGVTLAARAVAIHGQRENFEREIRSAREAGDSVGGVVECSVEGMPAGLGGALFDGIESELSAALFAIPGVKGVEFGNGFAAAELLGSENNDPFVLRGGKVETASDRHGGILGGYSLGLPIRFRVAFKPTPTIFKAQPSVDLATMTETSLLMKGRHDPCIVLRALPVVEAVAAFAFADLILADEAERPRICLTLTGHTLEESWAQYEVQRYFTDLVELRVDWLSAEARAQFSVSVPPSPTPLLVTFRRRRDGGEYDGPEAERIEFFKRFLSSLPDVGRRQFWVDFEEDFRHEELTRLAQAKGVRIIRSLHDFSGPVKHLVQRLRELRGNSDEIPKIAFMPRNLGDVEVLFDGTVAALPFPHIVVAMGPLGVPSRALANGICSFLTYASVKGLTALGHFTPAELVRIYRLRETAATRTLFGVTGWPLLYTRSPELHNAALAAANRDAVMVPVPTEDPAAALSFMKRVGLQGMAVTIPHKVSIMPLLDAIAPEAAAIGAVNTIAVENGRYVGRNTDAEGFAAAIAHFVGRSRLDGLRAAVLGAGGASKAVVYALNELGAAVEIFHRRTPGAGFDLIVNATPVDPIPDYAFTGRELVYDLVYAPPVTPLLARARAAGCRVENGLSMLVAQAAAQRRIWGVES